jgi:glycosyltransferase involved in cell wall biosynthesis
MVTPMPPRAQAPGAIPVVLHAQLQGLRRNHAVTVVTVAGPEPDEAEAVNALIADGVPVRASLRSEPRGRARWQRRWRLGSRWLRGQWPWRTVWFWDDQVQRLLDQELGRRHYDLVQIEDNAMGAYRYPPGIPTIFTEHEVRRPRAVPWPAWPISSWPAWLLRETDWQRWPRYQRRVWRKFDRLQVFTQRDADRLADLAPDLAERVHVNPFGIELPNLEPAANEDSGSLLFVGNFTHPPNVDAALWLAREILPRVRARHARAHLTLVGIFPPPEVLALAGAGVSVTGPVPAIDPYFQRAAVCVAPVRIGGGMRTKVLQAMAYGKPVVTTARGAEGLSMNNVPPPLIIADDADGLALGIADLLADLERRRVLGQAARAYVAEHFSPRAYAARLEAIYAGLGLESSQPTLGLPARARPATADRVS